MLLTPRAGPKGRRKQNQRAPRVLGGQLTGSVRSPFEKLREGVRLQATLGSAPLAKACCTCSRLRLSMPSLRLLSVCIVSSQHRASGCSFTALSPTDPASLPHMSHCNMAPISRVVIDQRGRLKRDNVSTSQEAGTMVYIRYVTSETNREKVSYSEETTTEPHNFAQSLDNSAASPN